MDNAYPTEQALRQKEAKLAKKKALEDKGWTKEEIKNATKRKPQPQEQHFDDCGSDTTPLEELGAKSLLAYSGTLDDAVAYSFFDDHSCGEIPLDIDDYLRDTDFCFQYLLG